MLFQIGLRITKQVMSYQPMSVENKPSISAILCTTGTRAFFIRTVESLLNQSLAIQFYEIVVVLNNSDSSRLSSFENELYTAVGKHKRLRVVQEMLPGLSHARNRGIQESRGKYVAYIDDDAIASPQWLKFILNAFCRDRGVAAVGGDIEPLWEQEKPNWITPPMYTYFSCKRFGLKDMYMPTGSYFFGTNMAFVKQVLLDCSGFPTNLGRVKDNLLSNEEWPVFEYIDNQNLKKWYSPAIKVEHFVPRERMTPQFFIRRLWWQGVSNTVYSLECKGVYPEEIAKQAIESFVAYYRTVPSLIRHGHSSLPLAFFNLFRWAGIFTHLSKTMIF